MPQSLLSRAVSLALFGCVLLPSAAWAGTPPGASATPGAALPPAPGQILRNVQPPAALPEAPGAVFSLPSPQQQRSESTVPIAIHQIVVQGNTVLPAALVMQPFAGLEGRTVTLGQLQAAADQLTTLYHQHGYPIAYAFVPAQKVKSGRVTVQVVEPRYDQIQMHNDSRLSSGEAQRTLGLQSGAMIRSDSLNRGLLLLSQTPGIRVAGTLVPGATPNTSSLEVNLHNRPLLWGSAGVNNYGSNYTGRVQWQGQVAVRNPFGFGGEMAANGITTSSGLLHGAGLSLLSPNLWNGLRANLFASWTHYRLGQQFAPLDETGQAIQWGGGFSYPIILQPGRQLTASLTFLQDRFQQEIGLYSAEARYHLNLVQAGLSGALDGGDGVTSGSVTVTAGNKVIDRVTPGYLNDLAGQPGSVGSFWLGQLQLRRLQNLPAGFRLDGHLLAQVASKNLDASQQLYLGGPYGIESYSVGAGAGDQGLLARLSLSHRIPGVPGDLRLAALLQGGEVWQVHNYFTGAPLDNRLGMAGAGVGLRYTWQGISLHCAYVHQIGGTKNTAGANQENEIWASLTVTPSDFEGGL